jgi:hypothetical protein
MVEEALLWISSENSLVFGPHLFCEENHKYLGQTSFEGDGDLLGLESLCLNTMNHRLKSFRQLGKEANLFLPFHCQALTLVREEG